MNEKNTFYIKFYNAIQERMGIKIYSEEKCEHIDLGLSNILYRSFVAVLYNFNLVKVNIEDDDRYFLLKIETEKSLKQVARIFNDFFSLMTDKD